MSKSKDCASLALIAYSTIVSDSFDAAQLLDVSAAWLDGKTVCYVGNDATLSSPYTDAKIAFIIEKVN